MYVSDNTMQVLSQHTGGSNGVKKWTSWGPKSGTTQQTQIRPCWIGFTFLGKIQNEMKVLEPPTPWERNRALGWQLNILEINTIEGQNHKQQNKTMNKCTWNSSDANWANMKQRTPSTISEHWRVHGVKKWTSWGPKSETTQWTQNPYARLVRSHTTKWVYKNWKWILVQRHSPHDDRNRTMVE